MHNRRWLTFDCYGTLTDWLGGMRNALAGVVCNDAERLLAAYHGVEMPWQAAQPHLPYRTVLTEGLRQAAVQERLDLAEADTAALVRGWPDIEPFEDTVQALTALRQAGWSLAVLTNCDDDLFETTRPKLGVELDEWVTATDVASYKPRLPHFHEFARRTGATRENWVHAANSWVLDVVPARRLGLTTIWIDRDRSGHDPTLATAHIATMAELPQTLDDLRLPGLDVGMSYASATTP